MVELEFSPWKHCLMGFSVFLFHNKRYFSLKTKATFPWNNVWEYNNPVGGQLGMSGGIGERCMMRSWELWHRGFIILFSLLSMSLKIKLTTTATAKILPWPQPTYFIFLLPFITELLERTLCIPIFILHPWLCSDHFIRFHPHQSTASASVKGTSVLPYCDGLWWSVLFSHVTFSNIWYNRSLF